MQERQLEAYLDRIGERRPVARDLAALERLQRAHRLAIPFENLDIPLGRGIRLEPDRLFAKIVEQRRGGYCFEQNGLFLRVLAATGFRARPLLARVWLGNDDTPPRTHTFNLVEIGEDLFVADVGFGGSMAPPLPLAAGAEKLTTDQVRHRLVPDPVHMWMLERNAGDGWQRQYSFTLEQIWNADLEAANHFTATRPGTRFTTLRVVSMAKPDGLVSLVDRRLTVSRVGRSEEQDVGDASSYRRLLSDHFGLDFGAEDVAALGLF
jgi:N-hydroxyarylamine O-acetyltransferase